MEMDTHVGLNGSPEGGAAGTMVPTLGSTVVMKALGLAAYSMTNGYVGVSVADGHQKSCWNLIVSAAVSAGVP